MDEEILITLQQINKRLENIELELVYLKKNCYKMSSHIDFVENVYDSLKKPLQYIGNLYLLKK